MSSQTAAAKTKDTTSSAVPIRKEENNTHHRLDEAISRRAYQLFEETGRSDGQDLSHWLQAQSELVSVPEIRESSSWYTISYPLRGFSAEDVQIDLDPQRAIISAEKSANTVEGNNSAATRETLYLVADWPGLVDPATASAYIKNDSLTLTVRRAENAQSNGA
jgi:HSP20 family molecular chaperone IbpA